MRRLLKTTMGMGLATALLGGAAAAQDSMRASFAAAKAAPAPTATIAYDHDPLQHGTLRLPTGTGPFPLVVLIHGGCWTKGFAQAPTMEAVSAALAARGIAVWNVEYRQVGDVGGGWPGTFQDIAAAVDRVPALAKRYPLDLQRVSLVGHSAGAHLALWAASRPQLATPWHGTRVKPVSVVAIDGPGQLAGFVGADAEVCGKPVITPLLGGTPDAVPERYRIASPSEHQPLGLRQLLVEGALAPFMQPYLAAARKGGDPVEVLAPAGADHFDIVTPDTANGAKVIDFIAARAFAKR